MTAGEWMVGDSQLLPALFTSAHHGCSLSAATAGLTFAHRAAIGCGRTGRRCLGERRQHAA